MVTAEQISLSVFLRGFSINHFLPSCILGGFNDGVLPGMPLLSLCLLSGFPVDSAILLGTGFKCAIILKI